MKRLVFSGALLIVGALHATRIEYGTESSYTGPLFKIEVKDEILVERTTQDPRNPRRSHVMHETEVRKTTKEMQPGEAVSYGIYRNDLNLIKDVESKDALRHLTLAGIIAAARDAKKLAKRNDQSMVIASTIGSVAAGLFVTALFTLPHEHLKKHLKALGLLIGGTVGGALGFAHARDNQHRAENIKIILFRALLQRSS